MENNTILNTGNMIKINQDNVCKYLKIYIMLWNIYVGKYGNNEVKQGTFLLKNKQE